VSRKQTTEYGDRLGVQLTQGSRTWYVGLVYMPSRRTTAGRPNLYQQQMDELQREVLLLRHDTDADVVIMGDFNSGIGGAKLVHSRRAGRSGWTTGGHRATVRVEQDQ